MLAGGCRATLDPAAIDDALTAARVKTALVNDPELGVYAIEVRVAAGTARLSGRVQTQAQADRAVALARAVSGVSAVDNALLIGGAVPSAGAASPRLQGGGPGSIESFEPQPNPTLFALGASLGWSAPRENGFRSRTSVGPLVRLGSGSGLGVAVGFDWFSAEVVGGGGASVARVHVKPIMAGLSYTLRTDRLSISPSLVGGYAFNGISVSGRGAPVGHLPIDAGNSLVWRPGASLWFDPGGRLALNVSGGYVMTRFDLTVIDEGRLSRLRTRGDALLLHAGVAYKVF